MLVSCKVCASSIKVTPSHYERGGGRYCSVKCHSKARTIQPEVPCPQCKKLFKPHRQGIGWQKYCNTTCSSKNRSKRVPRKCTQCGKTYLFSLSQVKHYKGAGKYCSKKCHGAAITLPKDAPVTDKYGRVDTRKHRIEWKLSVREKFKSICQRCGIYQEHIHTHHIAPRSQRPDLKFEVSNGITLCCSCHAWVHHHPQESVEHGWLSIERYEFSRSSHTTYSQQNSL